MSTWTRPKKGKNQWSVHFIHVHVKLLLPSEIMVSKYRSSTRSYREKQGASISFHKSIHKKLSYPSLVRRKSRSHWLIYWWLCRPIRPAQKTWTSPRLLAFDLLANTTGQFETVYRLKVEQNLDLISHPWFLNTRPIPVFKYKTCSASCHGSPDTVNCAILYAFLLDERAGKEGWLFSLKRPK